MGCCGKDNKTRRTSGTTMQLNCPICNTVLHGRTKTMPKISGNYVCGICYKKYKLMKELEKKKVKQPKKEKKGSTDVKEWLK